MKTHLVKLCVGIDTVDDLGHWQKQAMKTRPFPVHQTRMFPRKGNTLTNGGSIYWVIRHFIQVRQEIVALKAITDRNGRKACELVFDPELILVESTPRRPFQGWRYLPPEQAPADLDPHAKIPASLRMKLQDAMVW